MKSFGTVGIAGGAIADILVLQDDVAATCVSHRLEIAR